MVQAYFVWCCEKCPVEAGDKLWLVKMDHMFRTADVIWICHQYSIKEAS